MSPPVKVLPKLNLIEHQILTDLKQGNGRLFNEGHVNATNFNSELRSTMQKRLDKTIELCGKTDGQIIVWIKQNLTINILCL